MNARLFCILLVAVLLAVPIPAKADGIIIPMPPRCDPCPPPPCPEPFRCPSPTPLSQLVIRYHRVQVRIEDQVAVTRVDQVFHNPNDWTVEGIYLFPLPKEAAVSSFTLWVDGQPVEGEVLDAETARRTYEEIVRSMRDPALLEYAGQGALRASIFPIPPDGERRIELEYSQAFTAENGLVRYVYPLNTEKFSLWPLEEVSVSVNIQATEPIRAVYSPSHTISTSRENDNHVRIGYEEQDVRPDADFALYYSIGEAEAMHLLTYRDPASPEVEDGYFLLLLAPRPDAAVETLAKDIVLVLDRSGSMEGEKFRQAQDALTFVLEHLNPEDRFNIISFSTGLQQYSENLRPASEVAEAAGWVERLHAEGSTDINRALLTASDIVRRAGGERPAYVIFLTDGLPTEGVVESQAILDNLRQAAPDHMRLFSFGVGYDVDTFLLDSLSQAHHGTSSYVLPGERLDEAISAFYEKISTPVLTDLELDFGEISVYDLYPSPLPDLFSGSQIILAGRYRGGGTADIQLRGMVNEREQSFLFSDQPFPSSAEISWEADEPVRAAIPRLWATRKVGHLLSQIRLDGPKQELVDQVVALSIRYGIVTPYTSYLVTEEVLGEADRGNIASQALKAFESEAAAPAFGMEAVERAAGQRALSDAEAPASAPMEAEGRVRISGSRTFVLSDGRWVDTAFDPEKHTAYRVAFLSPEYFSLSESHPELAGAFALGENVIALSGGIAYEVVGAGESPDDLPVVPATDAPLDPPTPTADGLGEGEPPIAPTDAPEPVIASPGCALGLLPALLLPMALVVLRRRR